MNPHAPIIPPGQHPLSALPPIAEETGRHFAQFPPSAGAAPAAVPQIPSMDWQKATCKHEARHPSPAFECGGEGQVPEPGYGNSHMAYPGEWFRIKPPLSPLLLDPVVPQPATQFDTAAALDQLATLDTFAAAVADARSQGGPTAALRALIERPVKVGPFTLQKCSLFTFLFLNNIKSPYVGGGIVKDLDLAKALLAFTDPEAAAIYLDFHGEEVIVDFPQLTRDAYRIAGKLDKTGIAAATDWIASQIGGIGQLIPTGEEAGNFQTPAGTTPPPEMEVSPVLRAGSSFSSTS